MNIFMIISGLSILLYILVFQWKISLNTKLTINKGELIILEV